MGSPKSQGAESFDDEGRNELDVNERALSALARGQIEEAKARQEEAQNRREELEIKKRELDLHDKYMGVSWEHASEQLKADERVHASNTRAGVIVICALLAAFLLFTGMAMFTDNEQLAVEVMRIIVYGGAGWIAGRAMEKKSQTPDQA